MNRLESLNNQVNPIDPSENIIIDRWGGKTICVTLNNPRRKNAINTAMSAKLQAVAFNPQNSLIILKSNEPNVFGCGGDVKDLCSYIMDESSKTKLFEYFLTEFSTNYAFYLLNMHPICGSLAIYDGYTIGEAFILSFYSKIKIATENTIISMPECRNGLAIYTPQYFQSLPNNVGVYMWMTGESIKGQDCVSYGICDYYILSQDIQALEGELKAAAYNQFQNYNNNDSFEICRIICQKYAQPITTFANCDSSRKLEFINQLFTLDGFDKMMSKLTADINEDQERKQWRKHWANCIEQQSRIATVFNYDLLQRCLGEYEVEEFGLCQLRAAINMTFMYDDCREGLKRAVLNKKHQPTWNPQEFSQITQEDIANLNNETKYIEKQELMYEFDNLLKHVKQRMNEKFMNIQEQVRQLETQ